jgi:hypothetical protein
MEDKIRQILEENGVQGESLEEVLNLLMGQILSERAKNEEDKQNQLESLRSLLDSGVLEGIERSKVVAKIISLGLD